jgi:hypothetical protein
MKQALNKHETIIVTTTDPYQHSNKRSSLWNQREEKSKQLIAKIHQNLTKPWQRSKTTYFHSRLNKWWDSSMTIGDENDDNSCLREHLFTKANATPDPGKLTVLPTHPGRQTIRSSPYSSPIPLQWGRRSATERGGGDSQVWTTSRKYISQGFQINFFDWMRWITPERAYPTIQLYSTLHIIFYLHEN